MWIFGYGSLMWKVDFTFEEQMVGYIKGYERRFYQHSTDHRGTVENPGRVVTLIPSNDKETKVYGIAYKIKESEVTEVLEYLDYREKGGYVRTPISFHPRDNNLDVFHITIYVATEDNPQYAGFADVQSIADQVVRSCGPSGPNVDYVLNLAKAMRSVAPEVEDGHLFDLERAVLLSLKTREHNEIMHNI